MTEDQNNVLGTLNSNDMVLEWEPRNPVEINDFILPEYSLMSFKTFERLSCYSEGFPSPRYSDEPRISIDEAKNGSMCSATSSKWLNNSYLLRLEF